MTGCSAWNWLQMPITLFNMLTCCTKTKLTSIVQQSVHMLDTAHIWQEIVWTTDCHAWGHSFNGKCLYQRSDVVVGERYRHDFSLCAPALLYVCSRLLLSPCFGPRCSQICISNTAMHNVAAHSVHMHPWPHVSSWDLGYKVTVHIKHTKGDHNYIYAHIYICKHKCTI